MFDYQRIKRLVAIAELESKYIKLLKDKPEVTTEFYTIFTEDFKRVEGYSMTNYRMHNKDLLKIVLSNKNTRIKFGEFILKQLCKEYKQTIECLDKHKQEVNLFLNNIDDAKDIASKINKITGS